MTDAQWLDAPTLARAADLDALVGAAVAGTLTAAAEASHAIATTLQLKDSSGANIAAACAVEFWLSDTAGGAPTATDPTTNTAVTGTGAALVASGGLTHFSRGKVLTGATGSAVITTTQTAAHSYYLNAILPNGKLITPVALVHAG